MREELVLLNHVKQARTEAGLSQAQLAEMVGVSRNTLSSIETGQFTYVYTLGGVDAVAAPILSSVCVVSLVLSRIFLKEKLSWKTYAFIAVVIVGILLLAVAEEL